MFLHIFLLNSLSISSCASCGLHLRMLGHLRHVHIRGPRLFGRILRRRLRGHPSQPYFFLEYLKGIHLPIRFIETKYHLAIRFPLHPHLKPHNPILIPRFIYLQLLNITIQPFNLHLESHRPTHLRRWTTTTRPSPTWFDAILLALLGRLLATPTLPGLLQHQCSLHKYLNINNRKLHLFLPRHHHRHQARHLQHPLHDLRPRPNARPATLPDTGGKSTSPRP